MNTCLQSEAMWKKLRDAEEEEEAKELLAQAQRVFVCWASKKYHNKTKEGMSCLSVFVDVKRVNEG